MIIKEKKGCNLDDRRLIIYRQIGAKIAYYRTIRGLSQEELADKIALSKSTLSKIERGKYNSGLSVATLLDIADGLDVEMSTFVIFDEQEKRILQDHLSRKGIG